MSFMDPGGGLGTSQKQFILQDKHNALFQTNQVKGLKGCKMGTNKNKGHIELRSKFRVVNLFGGQK